MVLSSSPPPPPPPASPLPQGWGRSFVVHWGLWGVWGGERKGLGRLVKASPRNLPEAPKEPPNLHEAPKKAREEPKKARGPNKQESQKSPERLQPKNLGGPKRATGPLTKMPERKNVSVKTFGQHVSVKTLWGSNPKHNRKP